MGSTASTLSSSTLTELRRFNVFSTFPDDRSQANKLISTEATNALKYVNINFSSPINVYGKRKLQAITHVSIQPNRRSQRKVIGTPTRVISDDTPLHPPPFIGKRNPIFTSPSSFISRDNNTSSLIKSSISYRVLLPNDLFRIGLGDTIVLVVDKELFGFKKSISDYLVKDDIDLHSRVQNSVIKFEF